jgi:hypothetical protein
MFGPGRVFPDWSFRYCRYELSPIYEQVKSRYFFEVAGFVEAVGND